MRHWNSAPRTSDCGRFDQWTRREGFPVIREGKLVRIPLAALQEWLIAEALDTNTRPASVADLARLPIRRR